jgi:hypothetical protein
MSIILTVEVVKLGARGSQRNVVYLGRPIMPSSLSDRLEKKQQNAGVCGLSLAVYIAGIFKQYMGTRSRVGIGF